MRPELNKVHISIYSNKNFFSHTGVFIESKSFDTHGDGTAGDRMRDYLNTITGE